MRAIVMRRRCVLGLGLVVALTAMAPPAGAQEAPPPEEQSTLLFVQSATGGSLVPQRDSPSTFTLNLRGVDKNSLWFTDRPERRSGHQTTRDVLDVLDFEGEQGPPNAVLSVANADPAKNMVALTLRDPRYDAEERTLRYTATKLDDVTQTRLTSYAADLDGSVRRRFGSAALFIDSARPDTGCTLNLKWAPSGPPQKPLTFKGVQDYIPDFSKYRSTVGPGGEIPSGGTWSTTSGVGLGPTAGYWCRGGTSFTGPDGKNIFIFFNDRWTLTGLNQWGCNAPANYRCQATGNERGFFLTVNVNLDKLS